jgi:hypothetical protein
MTNGPRQDTSARSPDEGDNDDRTGPILSV